MIELLNELMRACYEVSQGKADVFFDYSPHVESIEIRIYMNGWKLNKPFDITNRVYLDSENAEELLRVAILTVKELGEEKCTK